MVNKQVQFSQTAMACRLSVIVAGLLLAGCMAMLAPSALAAQEGYRFGVFPYLPPSRLEESYAPIAAAFGRALSRPVRLLTANGFDRFHARLLREEFDIALIQPMDVVSIVDEGLYLPLANRPAHGASLVVLDSSPVRRLSDLSGATIGLPPDNVPVSIVLELALAEKGFAGARNRVRHFNNAMACLHQLLIGSVAACGTGGGASLNVFERKMGVGLRVVMQSAPFPHMLFVVHPRLPEAHRQRLRQVILGWSDTEQGRALLSRLGPDARFVPYRSEAYDVIRRYWQRWKASPHVLH